MEKAPLKTELAKLIEELPDEILNDMLDYLKSRQSEYQNKKINLSKHLNQILKRTVNC
jgi:hypothetical protein